jgi:bifunctional non-homologous end joining protein LigD
MQDEPCHWDLMLEADGVLLTYRLDLPPKQLLGRQTTATKIFDHPLKFLTYQGSVNKGLGMVQIADSGTYRILDQNSRLLLLDLDGQILAGQFRLIHIDGNKWEFRPCQYVAESK